jgi:hypothetical protein
MYFTIISYYPALDVIAKLLYIVKKLCQKVDKTSNIVDCLMSGTFERTSKKPD